MSGVLAPQPGPQTRFLSTLADICIYGGSAGGGKSFGLLLEPLRHQENSSFYGVFFRRTNPQLTNPGGLWDEAEKLYPMTGGAQRITDKEYVWDGGMKLSFRHMEHEKDKLSWQGAQVPFIGFDELTHFSESQFIYMMSRNRSASGVPGYIRGTCNPDPDSWVRTWIDWWIGEDGLPIPERSGVVRWFIMINDERIWASTRQELIDKFQPQPVTQENQILPKSFTFIPATIFDNKILLKNDPNYLASLKSMPRVEREQLLGGNWDVRIEEGSYYKSDWVTEVTSVHPSSRSIRFWDRAASLPSEAYPDPDWTVGVRLVRQPSGCHPEFVITGVERDRMLPAGVRNLILSTAHRDGKKTRQVVEQEPGSSGKSDAIDIVSKLSKSGFEGRKRRPSGDKLERFLPFSAACENGQVGILKGAWNDAFHKELEAFTGNGKTKDDQCDAVSGAFNEINEYMSHLGDFEFPDGFGTKEHEWSMSNSVEH